MSMGDNSLWQASPGSELDPTHPPIAIAKWEPPDPDTTNRSRSDYWNSNIPSTYQVNIGLEGTPTPEGLPGDFINSRASLLQRLGAEEILFLNPVLGHGWTYGTSGREAGNQIHIAPIYHLRFLANELFGEYRGHGHWSVTAIASGGYLEEEFSTVGDQALKSMFILIENHPTDNKINSCFIPVLVVVTYDPDTYKLVTITGVNVSELVDLTQEEYLQNIKERLHPPKYVSQSLTPSDIKHLLSLIENPDLQPEKYY